jgi:hypothetical protein
MRSRQQLAQINGPGEGRRCHHIRRGGDAAGPQVITVAVEEGGGVGGGGGGRTQKRVGPAMRGSGVDGQGWKHRR